MILTFMLPAAAFASFLAIKALAAIYYVISVTVGWPYL